MTANEEWLKSAAFPVNRDLTHAGVAQLVERNLAKVEVDGSNPFARSKFGLFISGLKGAVGNIIANGMLPQSSFVLYPITSEVMLLVLNANTIIRTT